jgi:DNA polymerase-3 subunit delta'
MLGHHKVLDTLQTAIKNDNVSHAYIFEGPDGIGKRETALSFSSMLLCEKNHMRCGECKSCRLFYENSHPDFIEIYQEDKSISVEDIRNVLKGLVIKPLYSKYKVIIINNADNMTVQAQNAVLKSLEEPPPYVVFILTVQSSAAMAATIRSRCQRAVFTKLSYDEIMTILESKYGDRKSEWDFIVSYADGVIGTAIELVESPHILEIREYILEQTAQLISSKDMDLFNLYEFFDKNSDNIDYILRVMLLFFRDIMIYNQTSEFSILINSDKKDMIIRNAGIRPSGIQKCIHAIWDAKRALEANVNFQLAIEVMLMKIKDSFLS